jgi:hypothetical protein
MSKELQILDELDSLASKLLTIAKKQNSYWLLAETYVLKARLALFNLDLQSSEQLIHQALIIAEEQDLQKLATKIFSEQTYIKKQTTEWQKLVRNETTIDERIELAQLESMILRIAHRKLEITDEETLDYARRAQHLAKTWDGN